MGVALIAWGRFLAEDGQRNTVRAPSTDPGSPWLLDFLRTQAAELSRVGFTALQLPPTSKAEGGASATADGYGVFDPRDIGGKPQQGSIPTRYGSRESLTHLVGAAHACDMDVYLDLVLHQRSGENGGPGVFEYLGADGRSLNGRGRTSAGWFRAVPPLNLPDDDVPNRFYDFEFGRELSYQHCQPHRVTVTDALDFGDWVFRTTGADGARLDDVKGTWAPFVAEFMRQPAMASKFFYAEFFDGDPRALASWMNDAPISRRSLVEDFPLHWALQSACQGGGALHLAGAGFAAQDSSMACTFVENPDTDLSPGQQVIDNKLLAYAFLLTIEGYPFVYGKDYYPAATWPGAYGLKPWIDNLVWIHEHLADGQTVTRFVDQQVIVLNRVGQPGLLTAINFDTWSTRTLTCQTAFGANVRLHDYTGRHGDIQTDAGGNATFTVPSNAYGHGQSYLCFSRSDVPDRQRVARRTTQTIFGAADLDIAPAMNVRRAIGSVHVAGGSEVTLRLVANRGGWTAASQLQIGLVDTAGVTAFHGSTDEHGRCTVSGRASMAGAHTLVLTGAALPAAGSPFEIEIDYMGTA